MEPLRYDRNKIFKFPEGRVIKWSVYKPPPKKLKIVYKIVIYENTPQQAKQQPTFTSNSALISFDEQT